MELKELEVPGRGLRQAESPMDQTLISNPIPAYDQSPTTVLDTGRFQDVNLVKTIVVNGH